MESKSKYIKANGGGGNKNFNPQKSGFKPLIATSLALALSVSVASGTSPSVTNDDASISSSLTWTEDSGNSGIYKPTNSGTPINILTFHFTSNSFSGSDLTIGSSILTGTKLNINGNGSSIKMGDNGTGTLEFRFGNSNNRLATLDLSNITAITNYALYGNLFIGGGSNSYTFTGNFGGKGIDGNITLDGQGTSNLTFENDAGISGRINLNGGTTTINRDVTIGKGIRIGGDGGSITFTGTNININNGSASDSDADGEYAIVNPNSGGYSGTINFLGESATITVGSVFSRYNGGAINLNVTGSNSTLSIAKIRTDRENTNGGIVINFGSSTQNVSNSTLKWNPVVAATTSTMGGQIKVNFYSTGDNKITKSTTEQSYTIYSKYMSPTIVFNNGNNTIEGSIRAEYFGNNNITFKSATTSNKIEGVVENNTGSTTINFEGGSTNQITGGVNNGAGSTNISFASGTTNNTIGDILASQSSQGGGQNTITFSNTSGTNTIGAVSATGTNYPQTSWNHISFNGNSSSVTNIINGDVTTQGAGGSSSSSNEITFTNGNNSINGNVSASLGTNTITFIEGTHQISGGVFTNSNNDTSINKITITAGTLTIQGNKNNTYSISTENYDGAKNEITGNGNLTTAKGIYAKFGTNTINIGTGNLTIQSGGITSTGENASIGQNTITANSATITGDILAQNGKGQNTLTLTTDSSISGGLSASVYGNPTFNKISVSNGNLSIRSLSNNSLYAENGQNYNSITLSKDGAILTLGGSITSVNQANNTINFDGASGILKSSSGDSISASGTTNINITSLTIQDNNSGTGTLTTTGGTTNLTFKDSVDGSLNGNITTTNGTTNVVLKDGRTYSVVGTFSTSGAGKNIFDLSSKSATISNVLNFIGSEVSGDGGNIINIGASKTLTLQTAPSTPNSIFTTAGVTTLNFNGASAGLSGNVSTSGGIANINFKDTSSITGTLDTSSTGTTNITITNGKNGSISGTTTAGGTAMKIDFLAGNEETTLALNSGSGTLSTTAGNTAINFNGSNGILSGLVNTDGVNAITTITIADNSNGTINGAVTTDATNGTTNISFASGENAKSLTLGANGNKLTDITLTGSSTANTLKLSTGTTEVSSNVEIADNQALTFSIGDSASLTLAGGLSNTGTANIVFVGNDSDSGSGTFSGNITTGATSAPSLPAVGTRDTSLAKTTITFADSGTKASTATLLGTLTAQNGGINEINIANNLELKVDSINALKLTGNTQGNNNIVLGSGATALSINKSDNSGVSHIDTIGGNTNITLSGQDNFTLTSAGIGTYGETAEGATTTINLNAGAEGINFKILSNGTPTNGIIYSGGSDENSLGKTIISFKDNATSTLTANIQTADYGITTFNLGSTSATTATAKLDGTIDNSGGKINFDVNAKALTLQADNLTFSGGENNINFANTTGATLSWKSSDGSAFETISTTDSGKTNINFNNSGTIAGDGIKASINTDGTTASTTITLANLPQTPAGGVENRSTRNANGVSAVIQGAVTTTKGTTTINFASGDSAKTLTLGGNNNTITDFAFDTNGNSTNNTIALSRGTTTFSGSSLSVGSTNAIAFNLADNTTLALTNGLANSGDTTFNFNDANATLRGNVTTNASGSTTFNLGSSTSANQSAGSATITIDGTISNANGTQGTGEKYNGGENLFNINAKNVTLKSGDSDLAFSAGLNVIEFANTTGATLSWKDKDENAQAIQTTGGNTQINFSNSGTIDGAVSTTGGNTTFVIDNDAYAVVTGNVTTGVASSGGSQVGGMTPRAGTASTDVNFTGNGALVLKGKNNNISNVILGSGSYALSLTDAISKGGDTTRGERRNLIINNLDTGSEGGSLTLGTQTTTSQADTFVIQNASGSKQGTYRFGIIAENGVKLEEIGTGESGAVRLASVVDGAGISFESRSIVISGFTEATADITHATTDVDGNIGSGYTSYYIGRVSDAEVIAAEEEITATAFTLNYDLYMANLNSLNKRMGELRENAHSQGVWARVFNGALSNDFGLGSKNNYTTIQAGYDYAFGSEGANNYLGVALSYALSTSTSQNAFDSEGQKRGIDNIYSNAVEVALYNSYVTDMGWYNDSIAKFSYITSKFDISNFNTGSVTNNDTTNFAFTLSDEVGYVFKLGENKEWSITPQVEATFGYFNQSDFKQTLANSTSYLASSADAVLTMRARVGSAFAYDFKNFTQKDNFNASLYIGAFYEYDYVSGGRITLSTDQINGVENALSDLSSDGRVVMNVGTNMSIKDNTRLYFDFEKSFAGKITTDYQVNFGVRYSFGESNGYTPMIEKAEFKALLKVEGEEAKEGDSEEQGSEKAQESKEAENTTDKTQEKTKNTQEKKAQ